VKRVRTDILEIGYHERGPSAGMPVILLHGFPDDAHAYDGVSPLLATAGHRALAVYLRGYGPTRFLDPTAPRTAEQAAIGQDVIDFADALRLQQFAVVGFDCAEGRERADRQAGARVPVQFVQAGDELDVDDRAVLPRAAANPEEKVGAAGQGRGGVAFIL
jgi:hypothetical protein